MIKCKDCIVAFHYGHNTYTKKEYLEAKKRNDIDCCGGTKILNYCPVCGNIIKNMEKLK